MRLLALVRAGSGKACRRRNLRGVFYSARPRENAEDALLLDDLVMIPKPPCGKWARKKAQRVFQGMLELVHEVLEPSGSKEFIAEGAARSGVSWKDLRRRAPQLPNRKMLKHGCSRKRGRKPGCRRVCDGELENRMEGLYWEVAWDLK